MKLRASVVASVLLMLSMALFGQNVPTQEYAYTSFENLRWVAVFQVSANGTLDEYDLQAPGGKLNATSYPPGQYGVDCTPRCPFPTQPTTTYGPALNITPAAMNTSPGNEYVFFVSPIRSADPKAQPSGGQLTLGTYLGGEWARPATTYDLTDGNGLPVAVLTTTPSIGADFLPGNSAQNSAYQSNIAIVGYATPDKRLVLDAWWVPVAQTGSTPVGQNLTSFTPTSSNWDGNVSVAVRTESGSPDATKPYGVYLGIHSGNSIALGSAPMSEPAPDSSSAPPLTWTTITPPDGIVPNSTILVQRAIDNRMLVYYLNNSGQLGSYLIRGNAGAITSEKQPMIPLPGKATRVPSIAYSLGAAATTYPPDSMQPTLPSTEVPVFQTLLYKVVENQGDLVKTPYVHVANYGIARKEPLGNFTGKVKQVIGIIEGPPPVPNENIALTGSGNYTTLGVFQYGTQVDSASDSSFSVEGGPIVKLKTEAGAEGGVDSEASVKTGGGFDKETSKQTSSIATYQAFAKAVQKTGGKPYVDASGVAFLYGGTFGGYRFHFLDSAGKEIPGSTDRTVVTPVDVEIRAYPFDFDPKTLKGIIPGEITSYEPPANDPNYLAELEQKYAAYTFQNGSADIYYSWINDGSYGQAASMMNSSTLKHVWNTSIEGLIGGGEDSPLGSYSFMAGAYLNLSVSNSTSTTNHTNITTSIDFPAVPSDTPGVYTRIAYHVVPLKGDQVWLDELLDRLRSYPTTDNTSLLLQIVGDPNAPVKADGAPWKFTYVITPGDATLNSGSPGARMGASKAVPLPQSLAARGINTPHKLALLQHARMQMAHGLQPGAKDPVPPQIRAMASQLTAADKNQIDAYYAASLKERKAEFMKRHPNWKEMSVPEPKRNAELLSPARPHQKTTIDFASLANNPRMMKARPRTAATKVQ